MDDLMKRAFAAWFRSGGTDQPSATSSGVESHDGKQYVVLRNTRGVMKVYRVRPDGMLKGLRRYPAAFEGSPRPPTGLI